MKNLEIITYSEALEILGEEFTILTDEVTGEAELVSLKIPY